MNIDPTARQYTLKQEWPLIQSDALQEKRKGASLKSFLFHFNLWEFMTNGWYNGLTEGIQWHAGRHTMATRARPRLTFGTVVARRCIFQPKSSVYFSLLTMTMAWWLTKVPHKWFDWGYSVAHWAPYHGNECESTADFWHRCRQASYLTVLELSLLFFTYYGYGFMANWSPSYQFDWQYSVSHCGPYHGNECETTTDFWHRCSQASYLSALELCLLFFTYYGYGLLDN